MGDCTLFLKTAAVVACSLISRPVLASPQMDRLLNKRQVIQRELDRVVHGLNPCFSEGCQNQKAESLASVFRETEQLTLADQDFAPKREQGTQAAVALLREPWLRPDNSHSPHSVSEWTSWWKQRYSHREQIAADWKTLVSEVYELSLGLKTYTDFVHDAEDSQREIFIQAWDRGLPEVARWTVLSNWYAYQSDFARVHLQKDAAEKFNKQMVLASQNAIAAEGKLGDQLAGILDYLFPGKTVNAALSAISVIDRLQNRYHSIDLFDPNLVRMANLELTQVRKAWAAASQFDDLENGVMGIENFASTAVNPVAAAQFEYRIQKQLDQDETIARWGLEVAGFYVSMKIGAAVLGNTLWDRLTISAATQFMSFHFDGASWANSLWESSDRSKQLEDTVASLTDEVENRRTFIVQARTQFEHQLDLVNQQIQELQREPQP